MRRIAAFGAVFGALAGLAGSPATAPAQVRPRALIAFLPTQPAPKMPLLFDLAQRDFSYGVTSPTLGAYSKRQMLLDMSEGSRIANHAYPDDLKRLDLRLNPVGDARIKGWRLARKHARDTPADVVGRAGPLAPLGHDRAGRRGEGALFADHAPAGARGGDGLRADRPPPHGRPDPEQDAGAGDREPPRRRSRERARAHGAPRRV